MLYTLRGKIAHSLVVASALVTPLGLGFDPPWEQI